MNWVKNLLLPLLLLATLATTALAKERKTYAMSLKVFKAVEEINAQVDLQAYPAALEMLEALMLKRLSDYEKAQMWYLKGSIYYQMSRQDDAIEAFANVLPYQGNTPQILQERSLLILSQLNLVKQDYLVAEGYAAKLLALKKAPSAADYTLYAQVLFKTGKFEQSLDYVLKARKVTDNMQRKPKENLLLLQNAVYYELKNFQLMVTTLQDLIKYYPKANYLLFLASIHGQLDQIDKQTVLMESLYENGDLDGSSQLVNLASLYLSEKVPVKAARLLEKEMAAGRIEPNLKNYQMLSQAWRLAAEDKPALAALNEAARLSDDGELYLQKAYLHYDLMEWRAGVTAIHKALDSGLEPKETAEAWLLLGMVQLNLNKFDDAINACDKARNHEDTAKTALQWIKYIRSEQAKYQALAGL